MERQLVLASHGKFASGILSSLELICGKQPTIQALDCYVTDNFDLNQTVAAVMTENKEKEIVVITDLFGGSINNEFLRYIEQPNFYLIAGLNLPFLVEFVSQFEQATVLSEVIEQTLVTSKQAIQFCNLAMQQEVAEDEF
jgi:fructoselysine and glucoselysine-specific PTS system IIA component